MNLCLVFVPHSVAPTTPHMAPTSPEGPMVLQEPGKCHKASQRLGGQLGHQDVKVWCILVMSYLCVVGSHRHNFLILVVLSTSRHVLGHSTACHTYMDVPPSLTNCYRITSSNTSLTVEDVFEMATPTWQPPTCFKFRCVPTRNFNGRDLQRAGPMLQGQR